MVTLSGWFHVRQRVMATVRVRYFASLKEQRGVEEEDVELQPGDTLRSLYHRLCPEQAAGGLPVAYACNHAYAEATHQPAAGDEISFLPPIGGG